MKNLNELKNKVYKCAVEHGWHEENLSDEHFLCLVISELMEAVESDRNNRNGDIKTFIHVIDNALREEHLHGNEFNVHFINSFDVYVKDCVGDELCDAVIRLLDFAGMKEADIMNSIDMSGCMKNISLTEFCYKLSSLITNPDRSIKGWVEYSVSKWIALIEAWCIDHCIDLHWHIEQKIRYNELRPYKHGDKKY